MMTLSFRHGRVVSVLLAALCCCGAASSEVWYVDQGNVSGVNTGATLATAFTDIQTGIDEASDGDQVIVAPGTYAENVYVNGKDIVLQSVAPTDPAVVADTVIDGGDNDSVVTFRGTETARCVLSGFTITNGSALRGGGISGGGCRATITRCFITLNQAIADQTSNTGLGGGLYNCKGIIQHCTIVENDAGRRGGGLNFCPGTIQFNTIRGNGAENGGGISTSNGLIRGNIIRGNGATDIGGGLYSCSGIVQNNMIFENRAERGAGLGACDALIQHNTVVYNTAEISGGGMSYCSERVEITNCIVWGNAPERSSQMLDCEDPTFSCVQWLRNPTDGNINERPRFIDKRNGNFHLRDSSPCIDAGTAILGIEDDIEGDARGFDGTAEERGDGSDTDMGADEFVGVEALVYRREVDDWQYVPGAAVDIAITIDDFDFEASSSNLVISETLPQDWTYGDLVSGTLPDVVGVNGPEIEFSWTANSGMPALPTSFVYRVNAPTSALGPQALTGVGTYDLGGESTTTKVVNNTLLGPEGGPLDASYVDQVEFQGESLGWTFQVGLNQATENALDEITGDDGTLIPTAPPGKNYLMPKATLPAAFDWRDLDGLTPIKYQDVCGSCWTFTTNGVVEALLKIKDNQTYDLSEQYLLSANTHEISPGVYWSCAGGSRAFDQYYDRASRCGVSAIGMVLEASFPYVASDAAILNCPYSLISPLLDGWGYVGAESPTEEAIKTAIMDYGPVYVSVTADAAFQGYTGDVFNNCTAATQTNHGVVLAGWDDAMGASGVWILRNSWSTLWGDEGYMYIPYDCSNVGRWATYAEYKVSQQTGSLTVTLAPAAAIAAGATWDIDGSGNYSSGQTVSGLSAGTHTISYDAATGYASPASVSVEVLANQTVSRTGTYTAVSPATGSVTATIEPAAARTAGAQWQLDGGTAQNSGAQLDSIDLGSHTVSGTSVSGWSTPASESVSVTDGGLATVTLTYEQNGAIKVTLTPQAAIDAGARWQVDGGTWRASGDTVTDIATGSHTVSFKSTTGYTSPTAQSVDVGAGQLRVIDGDYLAEVGGSLLVTLSPQGAIDAGAQWRVDGGAWNDSGDTADGLAAGQHTVSYKAVASWDKPSNQTLTIDAKLLVFTSGQYTVPAATGSVSVTLAPQGAIDAGAMWRIDGGTWQASGTTVSDVSTGNHTVSFSTVSNWTTPSDQTVTVSDSATATATGTYTSTGGGSVKVNIEPAGARTAGAQWRVDGGAWQNSGATVGSLSAGSHTLSFKSITSWDKPADRSVTVTEGGTSTVGVLYSSTACTSPNTPQNVQATDGTFSNLVRVTWSAVSGSTIEYQVLRSDAGSKQATAISGWITGTTYDDTTAGAATPGTAGSCGGCGGTGAVFRYYNYSVLARNAVNCESNAGGPNQGYRGESAVKTFERVFPSATGPAGLQSASTDSTLAIRLKSGEAIDSERVWGVVSDSTGTTYDVDWYPVEPEDTSDIWVVFTPEVAWAVGDTIAMTVGAATETGTIVGPVTYDFLVEEASAKSGDVAPQPENDSTDVSVSAEAAEAMALGPIYGIGPDQVFAEPVRVWLPLPQGQAAEETELFFYHNGGLFDTGWYPAEDVAGWLVPGSEVALELDGQNYLGILVRHGGEVQAVPASALELPQQAPAAVLLPLFESWLGSMAVLALCLGVVAGVARRYRRGVPHRP